MSILGAGCASVPPPPPVDQAMLDLAVERGVEPQALENGRRLYLTRCTNCHGNVRLDQYDPLRWPTIMDRMAPLAGLDLPQRDDLEDYLQLARALKAAQGDSISRSAK